MSFVTVWRTAWPARLADLLAMLKTPPADGMEAVPVGPAVNKVANDGPECVESAA